MRLPANATLRVAAKIELVWESTCGLVNVAPPGPKATPITGWLFVSGPTDHTRVAEGDFWAVATAADTNNSDITCPKRFKDRAL